MRRLARFVAWTGLTAAGALHAIWGSGSSWPARNSKELAAATLGSTKRIPGDAGTWAVSGTAFVGGAVAAGALGEGRVIVGARRLAGAALITRAALGGEPVLRVMGLPAPGKQFQELDRRYYRPAFAILGAALIIGARKRRPKATQQPR